MKLKNNPANLIFWSFLITTGIYLAAIYTLLPKILSSATMQFMFLWQYHYILPSVFWPNIIGGLLISTAFILVLRSGILMVLQINRTHKFLLSLNLATRPGYFLFSSNSLSAFTAGFFNPQIYLSSALVNKCTAPELSAIILHESGHQANFDPIKDLLINFSKNLLPPFLGKFSLFNRYFTATEIAADAIALNRTLRRPLISALVKVLKAPQIYPLFSFNYFSGNEQRFGVLTGTSHFSIKSSIVGSFAFTVLTIFATTQLFHSSIFVECQHLLDCLKSLTKPQIVHPIINNLPYCQDDRYILHL